MNVIRGHGSKALLTLLLVVVSQIAAADAELGLKNFAQFYQNLLTSFSIDSIPNDLRDAYLNAKSRLPQTGKIEDMNTAVPVSQLMLAHKACQVFVNQDSQRAVGSRKAFGPIDFAAPITNITPEQIQGIAATIGSFVLLEPLTTAQQTELNTHAQKLMQLLKDRPQAASLLMTEVCTMVTSSIGAIVI